MTEEYIIVSNKIKCGEIDEILSCIDSFTDEEKLDLWICILSINKKYVMYMEEDFLKNNYNVFYQMHIRSSVKDKFGLLEYRLLERYALDKDLYCFSNYYVFKEVYGENTLSYRARIKEFEEIKNILLLKKVNITKRLMKILWENILLNSSYESLDTMCKVYQFLLHLEDFNIPYQRRK